MYGNSVGRLKIQFNPQANTETKLETLCSIQRYYSDGYITLQNSVSFTTIMYLGIYLCYHSIGKSYPAVVMHLSHHRYVSATSVINNTEHTNQNKETNDGKDDPDDDARCQRCRQPAAPNLVGVVVAVVVTVALQVGGDADAVLAFEIATSAVFCMYT